ncbi:UDP-N-acetylglucosamine diphosphorylase 1 [Coccomyxa sp. Obi]|nr:UDP-N-acetylglucosamine diphosphorylase 1 [Coccomyxa sp. Obi]
MAQLIVLSLFSGGLFYAYKRYVEHRQTNGQPGVGRKSVNLSDRQQHITKQLRRLSGKQHQVLAHDLQEVDMDQLQRIFDASKAAAKAPTSAVIEPLHEGDVKRVDGVFDGEEMRWIQLGFKLIAEGRLGVVLMAGGQGTRLGSSAPKGCYDIGLPSHKSLFQLFAERLRRLQHLAAESIYGRSSAVRNPVRWYIMTSAATDAATREFFQQHAYFGLDASQIVFFQQGTLPCLTEEGRIILESPCKIARAPDGNGGIYRAMQREGVLEDMAQHGVECVDCISVDNALVRLGDPLFAGYCHEQGAECGARVVAKAYPEERVGVFARKDGCIEVVEYSELDPQQAAATLGGPEEGVRRSSWGRLFSSGRPGQAQLKYNWSNVCMHYFTVDFLEAAARRLQTEGQYHIARKKIPSIDGPVQGIKLELFIFDTFVWAERVALLEVKREEEFAPVKNAPGADSDSPDTARRAILSLHTRWVAKSGGRLRLPKECEGVEVSPTVSYSGEGLRSVCRGRTFRQQHDMFLQGLIPERVAGKQLAEARRADLRTPGATPLATPGATPMGSPRSQAPLSPFTR